MDQGLQQFREAAARENRGRPAIRRRYSPDLRRQGVAYWQRRHQDGDSLRTVAAALGVAEWSLRRWVKHAPRPPAFRPVTVMAATDAAEPTSLVVKLTADGAQIEGLDVDTAARLLRLLR